MAVLYTQIQFNRVQVYHLQLIKYGAYGVYTYSYKKLGTRTLVGNVISVITLMLDKNRFTLHRLTCRAFSRNLRPHCSSTGPCDLQTTSCLSVLCAPRVFVGPVGPETRENPGFVGPSKEKE